ncbi:PTS sugar transporter subunit IIA [Lactiplantibacillus argentoratensis]|jgi:PTS system galactitol-specific IIA component|uniref:PTS sugar transporter subunit IIA n=1 Tax=Lactiplantibacillus argentoratensis TaxID=271881 RepID=UPI00073B9730|nr:PTS sugar transporter subunit IIA [Lactiplantibacillus argentoratensis]KTF00964.1 PTS system galactitol-specific IIA component [Lactiplantibacillus plantarum]GEK63080.1 PTS fructose transporter subunit IIA [Lactobacillus japonicus]KZT81912.1 PTS system galactitol-specific IIA component [Lactiplantibacillus plantarum]MBP5809466.1 PTS sugar transporter subunit IIA [Lactiplantibacillus argentoratensis]MCA5597734.1 PTS sugar transporter subunit IIA [Lactiplantibacillus argentoratensis]
MPFEFINKNLVFPNKNFNNQNEALAFLADQLTTNGYAKSTFKAAVLKRETVFPTGLPTGNINVAIPHADWQNVTHSGIAISTLTNPIEFSNMADPNDKLQISMIFMLAIDEPHGEVKLLKELMKIVQNQKHLAQLLSYDNVNDLYIDLKDTFSTLRV